MADTIKGIPKVRIDNFGVSRTEDDLGKYLKLKVIAITIRGIISVQEISNVAYMQCKDSARATSWRLVSHTSLCACKRCKLGKKRLFDACIMHSCRRSRFCCHSYLCTE